MVTIMLIILFLLLMLGFPVIIPLLAASLVVIMVFFDGVDPLLFIQQLVTGIDSYTLLCIPLFIFAANIMTAGETANRLLDFTRSWIGHFRGGLAITTVAACTLFGGVSGSSQATIAAIGPPMRKKMLQSGYKDSAVLALIVNSADLAMLIPPSIVMIMYAVVTNTSISDLFIAGIIPGIIVFLVFSAYSFVLAKTKKYNVDPEPKASMKERWIATKRTFLSLGFPIIVIGGIYTGITSPTEAAAFCVLYAIILELLVYKTINLRKLYEISLATGTITAVVFILLSAGQAFAWVLSYAQIPQMVTESLLGSNPSSLFILVITSVIFFIACMFVDSLVAITVITPIIFPPAMQAGIDPVALGIIITMQAAIGAATPPFGIDIFTACAVFNRPYLDVIRGTAPYIVMLLFISVLFIFFPWLPLLI